MNKDCNTCANHEQGRSINDCPVICWSCFDHAKDPLELRNWTPKPGALELVPLDPEPEYVSTVVSKAADTWTLAVTAKDKQVAGSHYKNMGVEPWDVVDTWPLEQRIGAYRHGVLKYTMRMGSKDKRLQEAQKALHYCEKLVEALAATDAPEATSCKGSCMKP